VPDMRGWCPRFDPAVPLRTPYGRKVTRSLSEVAICLNKSFTGISQGLIELAEQAPKQPRLVPSSSVRCRLRQI
jgi:hypothetical protein